MEVPCGGMPVLGNLSNSACSDMVGFACFTDRIVGGDITVRCSVSAICIGNLARAAR